MTEAGERLQKVLARAGVASRRAAEQLIVAGRVAVNGRVVTELGTRVGPGDEVRVDGRTILAEEPVYYALHKPQKMITSLSDPEGRPCVGDLARAVDERIFPVGRLDWDAEGLLLLTNDGALANRLTHPRYGVARTYDAKVRGVPSEAVLEALRAGVRLEDGLARPESVTLVGHAKKNTWVRVVVAEGRPHLVKRLLAAVGHPVQRLRRVAYGGIELGDLEPEALRPLTAAEVRILKAAGEGAAPRGAGPGAGPPSGKRPDRRPGAAAGGRGPARKPPAGRRPKGKAPAGKRSPGKRPAGKGSRRGGSPAKGGSRR